MWPAGSLFHQHTPHLTPPQYERARTSRNAAALAPSCHLLALLCGSKPLWITWLLQKTVESGLPVAFRSHTMEQKELLYLCFLGRAKDPLSSSCVRVAFAKLYLKLRKGELAPAGRKNWNAFRSRSYLLLPASLLLPPLDAGAQSPSLRVQLPGHPQTPGKSAAGPVEVPVSHVF